MLKIAYDPIYCHPLPEGHRFPMQKYELIPGQLLYEGTFTSENLYKPQAVRDDVLQLTHCPHYIKKLNQLALNRQETRKIGFPLSVQLVKREYIITGGTLQNVAYALENGISLNVAGGTHHAFFDRGEGFCIFNDFAVAANHYTSKKLLKKILIADLDVHQGNGTAALLAANPRVFTFSMHGKNNFPLKKEKSDLDIPLEDRTHDNTYLQILLDIFPKLLDKEKPDLVMYLSGVDVIESDKLGRLSLSRAGCKNRDEIVFAACKKRGIPLTVSMGGGYAEKLSDIVEAHANTFRLAKDLFC